MRRSTDRRRGGADPQSVATIAAAVLVIAAIVVVIVTKSGHKQDRQAGTEPTTAATTSTAATPLPTTMTAGPAPNDVVVLLGKFVDHYYVIRPGDSTTSRQAAFKKAALPVAPTALRQLNFVVFDATTDPNQMEDGVLDVQGVSVGWTSSDGKTMYVTAPVTLSITDDGETATNRPVMTASTWHNAGTGWTLTDFHDDYRTTGGQQ